MEFGSFTEFPCGKGLSQAEVFKESFDHVDMVEKFGLDGVWLAESQFWPRATCTLVSAHRGSSHCGQDEAKIGTAVHVLPLGNPLRTAEVAATLDHVSDGRLEFGVGRSGLTSSYEDYNIPYAGSHERFYECLLIILKAWTNEHFSYKEDTSPSKTSAWSPNLASALIRLSVLQRIHPRPFPESREWASLYLSSSSALGCLG